MSSFPNTPQTRSVGPARAVILEMGNNSSPITIKNKDETTVFELKSDGALKTIAGFFLSDTDTIFD